MRLLADESIEWPIVEFLRSLGLELRAIAEMDPGASDESILATARRDESILVTNDKDFSDLAFAASKASIGIVLVRLPRWRSTAKALRLADILTENPDRLRHYMTVVEESTIRRRRLPQS